jgi:GDPmannose 4,6-dehydratase
MKKALVTGCTGQDGSYLLEFLLEKGYLVYGLATQRATPNTVNIKHILNDVCFIPADLSDQASIKQALTISTPDEIYNLGAQSFVKTSWDIPEHTANVNGIGVLRMLEGIRHICPGAKFYQASTSEMFGKVHTFPQDERTPFYPRSPYGVSKLYGHWITVNYRESYNMFNCSGILFNHDSPRRGEQFVTQKIAKAAARIKCGLQEKLVLGNLDAKRDIGHAKDYVYAMWLMLQQDKPDDYVISSGKTHSIKDMLDVCFSKVDLDWTKYVEQSAEFMRPAEVDVLQGDSTKARNVLGWQPEYSFQDIMEEMVDYQLAKI